VAACVLLSSSVAWAIDDRVLGRDDFEFAQGLNDEGYQDLALSLLRLVEEQGGAVEPGLFRRTRLDWAQDDASQIDDPIRRRDALVAVLHGKQRFVDDFKETPEADRVGDAMPELLNLIGETFIVAIKSESDERTIEALRTEGDGIFMQADAALQSRIDALKALTPALYTDDYARLRAARYNQPHLRYYQALLYAPGSAKRTELCEKAAMEYEEFDRDYNSDDAPMIIYYAYVDLGLCLKELGKNKEAIESLDKVICLRESYGDADETTGVLPIPSEANDIVDLICYSVFQKVRVLSDSNQVAAAVAAAKDYFATIPEPFDARSSLLLARALGDAQLDLGDAKGAADTARRMIRVDWYTGVAAQWGRDLLERAEK